MTGAGDFIPAFLAVAAIAGIFQSVLSGSGVCLATAVGALAIKARSPSAVFAVVQLLIVCATVDTVAGLAQRQRYFLVAGVVVTAPAINGLATVHAGSILANRSVATVTGLAVGIFAAKHTGNNGANDGIFRTDVFTGVEDPSRVHLIGTFSIAEVGITSSTVPVFLVAGFLAVSRNNSSYILDGMGARDFFFAHRADAAFTGLLNCVTISSADIHNDLVVGGNELVCAIIGRCNSFHINDGTYGNTFSLAGHCYAEDLDRIAIGISQSISNIAVLAVVGSSRDSNTAQRNELRQVLVGSLILQGLNGECLSFNAIALRNLCILGCLCVSGLNQAIIGSQSIPYTDLIANSDIGRCAAIKVYANTGSFILNECLLAIYISNNTLEVINFTCGICSCIYDGSRLKSCRTNRAAQYAISIHIGMAGSRYCLSLSLTAAGAGSALLAGCSTSSLCASPFAPAVRMTASLSIDSDACKTTLTAAHLKFETFYWFSKFNGNNIIYYSILHISSSERRFNCVEILTTRTCHFNLCNFAGVGNDQLRVLIETRRICIVTNIACRGRFVISNCDVVFFPYLLRSSKGCTLRLVIKGDGSRGGLIGGVDLALPLFLADGADRAIAVHKIMVDHGDFRGADGLATIITNNSFRTYISAGSICSGCSGVSMSASVIATCGFTIKVYQSNICCICACVVGKQQIICSTIIELDNITSTFASVANISNSCFTGGRINSNRPCAGIVIGKFSNALQIVLSGGTCGIQVVCIIEEGPASAVAAQGNDGSCGGISQEDLAVNRSRNRLCLQVVGAAGIGNHNGVSTISIGTYKDQLIASLQRVSICNQLILSHNRNITAVSTSAVFIIIVAQSFNSLCLYIATICACSALLTSLGTGSSSGVNPIAIGVTSSSNFLVTFGISPTVRVSTLLAGSIAGGGASCSYSIHIHNIGVFTLDRVTAKGKCDAVDHSTIATGNSCNFNRLVAGCINCDLVISTVVGIFGQSIICAVDINLRSTTLVLRNANDNFGDFRRNSKRETAYCLAGAQLDTAITLCVTRTGIHLVTTGNLQSIAINGFGICGLFGAVIMACRTVSTKLECHRFSSVGIDSVHRQHTDDHQCHKQKG